MFLLVIFGALALLGTALLLALEHPVLWASK